jgi:hypothetical protein
VTWKGLPGLEVRAQQPAEVSDLRDLCKMQEEAKPALDQRSSFLPEFLSSRGRIDTAKMHIE